VNKKELIQAESIIFRGGPGLQVKVAISKYSGVDTKDYELYELTLLLSYLKSFYSNLERARKIIGLNKLYLYPIKEDTDWQSIILKDLNTRQLSSLYREASKIMRRYKLTYNWEYSIHTAVLSHTLVIPNRSTIDFRGSIKEGSDGGRGSSYYSQFPALYFTHKTSVKELKDWLDKNSSLFELMQKKLPKRIRTKRNSRTLFWGQQAWCYRRNGINSWSQIEKGLLDNDNKHPTKNERLSQIPTPVELEKYYKRFVQSLVAIDNPK
jgi:hypothetical protein